MKIPYLTLEECQRKYKDKLSISEISIIFNSGKNIENAQYTNDIMSIITDKSIPENIRLKIFNKFENFKPIKLIKTN